MLSKPDEAYDPAGLPGAIPVGVGPVGPEMDWAESKMALKHAKSANRKRVDWVQDRMCSKPLFNGDGAIPSPVMRFGKDVSARRESEGLKRMMLVWQQRHRAHAIASRAIEVEGYVRRRAAVLHKKCNPAVGDRHLLGIHPPRKHLDENIGI
jgi:hypothetical protein